MSRSKAMAVLFYLGAVIIGAAVGIAVDRTLVSSRLDRMSQNRSAMRERFFTDLTFTPQQRASWDSIGAGGRRADSLLLAPIMPQLDSLRKATNASQRALLSAEQLKLYDERLARRPRPGESRR